MKKDVHKITSRESDNFRENTEGILKNIFTTFDGAIM